MRQRNYPFRNLPWYLGGTPETPLDPPNDEAKRHRPHRD
jgi:hypothetical protein